jgi:hypothetical protein
MNEGMHDNKRCFKIEKKLAKVFTFIESKLKKKLNPFHGVPEKSTNQRAAN